LNRVAFYEMNYLAASCEVSPPGRKTLRSKLRGIYPARNELPRSKLRGIPAGKKNASQQAAGYLPGKE
jgi:hypothetical protein